MEGQLPLPETLTIPMPNQSEGILRLKELAAGITGGMAQVVVGQPFDTIKVRLQMQAAGKANVAKSIYSLITNEGPLAFYKGMLSPFLGVPSFVSARFVAFEFTKGLFVKSNIKKGIPEPKEMNGFQNFICGFSGGVLCTPLVSPIEQICTRLQVQTASMSDVRKLKDGLYTGPTDLVRKVCAAHGAKALFQGFNITLLRDSIGIGLYFYVYESLISWECRWNNIKARNDISALKLCLYGAIAGQAYWTFLYPIDVIKTRIQTDNFEPAKRVYPNTITCLKKSLASGRLPSLYKGFFVCFVRCTPANAACFLVYERVAHLLGAR